MAPQTETGNHTSKSDDGIPDIQEDDIFITGISGSFPDSYSVQHLGENLFNKVDLISGDERRWKKTHADVPQRTGKVFDIQKFDASFFGVNYKEAHAMDPMARVLLEKTYECIIDAGYNPAELRGTKTGIILGTSTAESEKDWLYEKMEINDNGIVGCARSMTCNRIAQWLGVTGPSYSVDTACSSSMFALQHAFTKLKDGICDSMILCGSNLLLHPYVSLQFKRLGVLSPDGVCKSFDNRANGYVRAEAIVACFLQRPKDARRVYARLIYAKTNCDGYKEQGITYPAGQIQKQLLQEFYEECKVDPTTLEYVEAHGTGTAVGDPEELKAIDDIFCKDRKGPLLIGSIKSNLGHAEPSSGLCSIAKLCVAYNTGYIPPNVNFTSPREGVDGLTEGRLQVVTEKTPWYKGLFGISSFGFGGANAHALLDNVAREKKNNALPNDDLPRLVCVSGRTKSAVDKILDDLESRPVDVDQIALWHHVYAQNIPGHNYRGYVLLRPAKDKSVRLARDIQSIYMNKTRPVWFVYSGLTTNWTTYARQFMSLPKFAASIQKCHSVLEPKGFHLLDFISEQKSSDLSFERCSLIGIVAVHIALTDLMVSIGLKPDYVIGHDIAELSCAYADGCLSLEQTILAAYSIALASETIFNKSTMIVVKLCYQELAKICPKEIDISCHINSTFCSITGPTEAIKNFVITLTARGVSVSQSPTSVASYHSRYAARIAPIVLKYLKEIITKPKVRSDRWVSTSVPESKWNTAKLSSAEYHANSLINPVLFEESLSFIQPNSIIIEMGAQEMLPFCVNPAIEKTSVKVSLAKQYDSLLFFLNTLGSLFESGLAMQLHKLYPTVQFPVARGTPMLAHLVEWEHSEDWFVISFSNITKLDLWERIHYLNMEDEDNEYLSGHKIDGRLIYPATGYLVLVWEMVANLKKCEISEVSVVFEDVYFQRATNIAKGRTIALVTVIHKGTGKFEITENNVPVVTGRVYEMNTGTQNLWEIPGKASNKIETKETQVKYLYKKDFYKELNLRGYQYSGLFRGVLCCSVDATQGRLSWDNNWVSFLDTMMQVNLVSHDTRSLYVPTRLEKLSIDVNLHDKIVSKLIVESKNNSLQFFSYPNIQVTRCGGVELRNIHVTAISKKPPLGIPVYESNEFVPNYSQNTISFADSLRSSLQFILENVPTYKFKTLEFVDDEYEKNGIEPTIEIVGNILADLPLIQADLVVATDKTLPLAPNITISNKNITGQTNTVLFIGANLQNRPKVLDEAVTILKKNCFILSREMFPPQTDQYPEKFDTISIHKTETEYLVLLRQKNEMISTNYIQIRTDDQTFSWIEIVKQQMKDSEKLVLYSQNEDINGLLGLVNCLRKEPGGEIIYGLLIADKNAPPFDADLKFYKDQLDKNLALNVFKNGQWGTYRHLSLPDIGKVPVEHAYVNIKTIGDLSSLNWREGKIERSRLHKYPNTCIVHVSYSAINFRDVVIAMGRVSLDSVARGRLAQDCVQGIEITGRTENGTRVMAICEKGFSNVVHVHENLTWPVPKEWTLEEAVTVPAAYGTVYLAMVVVGEMRQGESILIHAGSGGVGQAAINIALHYGLEVFATVGTPAKREFIKRVFPQLKDSHIGNSRDTSFEEMIRRETNGRGVDLVLNSLSDDKLQASVKCLAHRGRFLEIGKYDITINTQLELCFAKKEISFHGIMLDYLFDAENVYLRKLVRDLVTAGIVNGAIRPVTSCTFESNQIEAAYRYMAAGKHIGKVIIKIRDDPPGSPIKPTLKIIPAIPRYNCHDDEVYVVIGGLGGFGLELIDWLVLRGARKLVVSSRRGVSNGYQTLRLRIWASYGVELQICTADVTTMSGCDQLLQQANAMGSVIAIFNLAVVLNDAVFTNQTPETFKNSYGPKAAATIHLDKLSRKLCPNLRDFVVFSSVSCGRGNAGQTNYGFSNSVMERICEERKNSGLPGLAIQWGAIGDVGLVADMQEENIQIEISGTLQQKITSCLEAMDKFLKQNSAAIVSSIVVAEKRTSNTGVANAVDAVALIMGISDLKMVSQQVPLSELGMDSIMAVEIKQTLEREFEIFLAAQDIRSLTFAMLAEFQDNADSVTKEGNLVASKNIDDQSILMNMLLRNFGDEKSTLLPFIDYPSRERTNNSDQVIFMLPGIESSGTTLKVLCSKLDADSCILQLGLDHVDENIDNMVQRIFQTVKSRLAPGAPFYLLGYSFGALPILELAAKLEKEGHKGFVFCLDGGPDFLKCLSNRMFQGTDYSVQNALLYYIIDLFYPDTSIKDQLKEHWNPKQSYVERIKYMLDISTHEMQYSKKFLVSMCLAAFKRIKEVNDYEVEKRAKIKSPITLIRQKYVPSIVTCDESYGLTKSTEGSVFVHNVEADHVSICDNDEAAKVINDLMNNACSGVENKTDIKLSNRPIGF